MAAYEDLTVYSYAICHQKPVSNSGSMALVLSRGHGLTSQRAMEGEMRDQLIKLAQETSSEYYPSLVA